MTRRIWLLLTLVLALPGCGNDPDAVNEHEKSVIKTVDKVGADDDNGPKTFNYVLWQGTWLTDDKGGKMRVVRVVAETDVGGRDMLYHIDDHDVKALTINTAGDAWKTTPIKWGVTAPAEAK